MAGLSDPVIKAPRLPRTLTWGVIGLSVLPFLLLAAGIDLGHSPDGIPEQADPAEWTEFVSASFAHGFTEWTGFCIAVFTLLLGLAHYRVKGDVTTPIIAVALFGTALFDVFHVLGASGLVAIASPAEQFIPFTWFVSRMLNALLLVTGMALFMCFDMGRASEQRRRGVRLLVIVLILLVVIVAAAAHVCAHREQLPELLRPEGLLARPWELLPLVLFAGLGGYVLPMFLCWRPTIISRVLLLSMVPYVAAELHMVFGSHQLFDSHSHIAHILKLVAYATPLAGLLLDYHLTHSLGVTAGDQHVGEMLVREQAEAAMQFDRLVLHLLLRNLPEAIGVKDRSRRYVRINEPQAELLGIRSPFEATGRTDDDFYDASLVASIREYDEQVISSGQPIPEREVAVVREADIVLLLVSLYPLKSRSGEVVGMVSIAKHHGLLQPREGESEEQFRERVRLGANVTHLVPKFPESPKT